MGILSYSRSLVPGAFENVSDVAQMLNEAKAVINGGIDTTNITDASLVGTDLVAETITEREISDAYGLRFTEYSEGSKQKLWWNTFGISYAGGGTQIIGPVAHGLGSGAAPRLVIATIDGQSTFGEALIVAVSNPTATQITVNIQDAKQNLLAAGIYTMRLLVGS